MPPSLQKGSGPPTRETPQAACPSSSAREPTRAPSALFSLRHGRHPELILWRNEIRECLLLAVENVPRLLRPFVPIHLDPERRTGHLSPGHDPDVRRTERRRPHAEGLSLVGAHLLCVERDRDQPDRIRATGQLGD